MGEKMLKMLEMLWPLSSIDLMRTSFRGMLGLYMYVYRLVITKTNLCYSLMHQCQIVWETLWALQAAAPLHQNKASMSKKYTQSYFAQMLQTLPVSSNYEVLIMFSGQNNIQIAVRGTLTRSW